MWGRVLPLQLCHYFYHFHPLTSNFSSIWLLSYVTSNSPAVRLLNSRPACPPLCSLLPVLAGTSPWHRPCWLKWQISSSADRAELKWWGFFFCRHWVYLACHVISSMCTCVSLCVSVHYRAVCAFLRVLQRFVSVHSTGDHSIWWLCLNDAWHLTTATSGGQNEPVQGQTRIFSASANTTWLNNLETSRAMTVMHKSL